ncbi:MAG: Double-stranded binding motif [Cyanobacteriota bacterium]
MPPNNTTSDGYEYGPTVNGKMYLSLFYHRGNGSKKDKHMWCVLPDHEYDIFFNSDKHDMYDSTQHYWGVLERGKVKIGENFYGNGEGKSKKEAEQHAASSAYTEINNLRP